MNLRTYIFFVIFICLHSVSYADRTGKMVIRGTVCEYDTVTYRPIAPGATLTQLQFNNILISGTKYKMKAHVITIDQNNQYNSLRPYLAKDSFFTINPQHVEIARLSGKGLKPVASIDGGGFVMSNAETSINKAYEISGSFVTNGEIKYESYEGNVNCYIDGNNTAHIGKTTLKGLVTSGNNSFTIGQVNHCRDRIDDKELISLFCNGIGMSRAVDANTGTDVKVKILNDSKKIVSSEDISCEVVSISDNSCNRFDDGEAILSGIGRASEFLHTLSKGDVIKIKLSYIDGNNQIIDVQNQVTNLLGYYIKDGVIQPNEQRNIAISTIGNSQDGKTVYLADLEISSNSNAPAICLLDLLKNIGVYDAMSLDGGPSAEMTVDGDYITVGSLVNGRQIPSGYILYSTAPADYTLTHLELANSVPSSVIKGATISLKLYGYNQYGEMIRKNAQNSSSVSITCTNNIGSFDNGVFTAERVGNGSIIIKLSGSSEVISIPVSVVEHKTLVASPKSVFTGEGRKCQIKLTYTDDNGTTEIEPSLAEWTTDGSLTVSSCANGLIEPYADGIVNVYATYNDVCDTIPVQVENLAEDGITCLNLSDDVKSTLATKDFHVTSVPKLIQAEYEGAVGSIVNLCYTLGTGQSVTKTATCNSDGIAKISIELDYDTVDTYPITIVKDGSSCPDKLYAYYNNYTDINEIVTKESTNSDSSIYNLAGQRVNAKYAKGILVKNGKKIIVR